MSDDEVTTTTTPLLRVVRGEPTAEQLAALIAVVAARAATAPPAVPTPPSGWTARAGQLRRPLNPGPGGWRDSAAPR